jgi:peroxiredoxin
MVARNIAPHLPGDGIIHDREPLLGRPAPEFQLKDEQGNYITLNRLTRQRPLLLHLYRGAW